MAYITDQEYQSFVQKLISPLSLKSTESKLSTLGLGLAGEIGEVVEVSIIYDQSKLIKELGDILWYITFGCIVLDINILDLLKFNKNPYNGSISINQLIINIGKVCEIIKKHLYHNKDLDKNKLILQLSQVTYSLIDTCIYYNIHIDEVKQQNFDKLSARYPSGSFNKQDFLNKEEKE